MCVSAAFRSRSTTTKVSSSPGRGSWKCLRLLSRSRMVRIAAMKASEAVAAAEAAGRDASALGTADSVVASDAFFPFADGLLAAIEAGATAVIQPGGSVRDKEVITAADRAGVAMVFTGMRHFRH